MEEVVGSYKQLTLAVTIAKMPRKKPSSRKKPTTKKKRPSSARIECWDADYLTTNPKSVLVNSDLIRLLANPSTWEQMTEDELKHIDTLFPDHVPREENGSISLNWLRYNNDWRHGICQWQTDLEAGRLDPEWQQEAAIAMEERAAGKFDKFKEEEFEEFWGQKQKMPWKMHAGQSSALKLPDLIAANLFKEGDFWVYSRGFIRNKDKTEVVKDCRIVSIRENSLTFAIPPSTLRYARKIDPDTPMKENLSTIDTSRRVLVPTGDVFGRAPAAEKIDNEADENGKDAGKGTEGEVDVGRVALEVVAQEMPGTGESGTADDGKDAGESTVVDTKGEITSGLVEDAVHHTIYNVHMLEDKILELDGRIRDPPHFNSWKFFRCQRDNQDMGSLFEIREQYYVWKRPG